MNWNTIIILGIFFIYTYINLGWTQKIFSYNRFVLLLVFAVALPIVIYFTLQGEYKYKSFQFSLILFYHLIILVIIKKSYNRLNTFLIQKKLVSQEFAGKDFTLVSWDSDIPSLGTWWDGKLATKPSWFDHFLTILLYLLPILIFTIVYSLTIYAS